MKPSLSLDHLLSQIKLPAQDQSSLSFCGSTKASQVAKWVEQLPATRISRTSVILYEALPEIIRLDTTTNNKLAILEHLRPCMQQCVKSLSQSFLNYTLAMPEEKLKAATIVQALQRHMSTGYTLVAVQLFKQSENQKGKNREQSNLLLALHRALTGIERSLFYCAQLYTPAHPKLWQELHTLYLAAEELGIHQQELKDPLIDHLPSSCQQIYIRTLLLASAGTNQITQQETEALDKVFKTWASQVQMIRPESSQQHCIYFDIDGNQGPSNKQVDTPIGSLSRALELSKLIDGIQNHLDGTRINLLRIPPTIKKNTLKHLIDTWSIAKKREQPRASTNKSISITVGLASTHYHLADKTPFNDFVLKHHSSQDELDGRALHSATRTNSSWSSRPTDNSEIKLQREKFPTYDVQLQDISSGGYCFKWRGEIPRAVKAGEILGICERNDNVWTVGVIRWVRQVRQGALLGVQVLSTRCEPCAIKLLRTSGEHGDYMRALAADATVENNLTKSVITATMPFREGSRVQCSQKQQSNHLHFGSQIFSTGAIQQLTYRVFEHSTVT